MTFLDAAKAVLEQAREPVSTQEIAARALAGRLLTLAGRTPEDTMRAHLTKAVSESPGNPFLGLGGDLFGLSEYPEAPPEPEPDEDDDDLDDLDDDDVDDTEPAPNDSPHNIQTVSLPKSPPVTAESVFVGSLLESAFEIIQASATPVSIRKIIQVGQESGAIQGELAELSQTLRTALAADGKDRVRSALRPRLKVFADGTYAAVPVSTELADLEKTFGDMRRALRAAVAEKIEQKLAGLSRLAFESICRMILHREGFGPPKITRVVDDTTYLEAMRLKGTQQYKSLIGLRSGGAEATRRTVGELRAGVKAREYDEGVAMLAGRMSQEAFEEWKNPGASIEVVDSLAIAEACVKHGIGVVPATVSIEFFDEEFFREN